MKTNSSFLGVGGLHRNDSKCRPHVARIVSSTPPPNEQTLDSSVFRGTKQLQRSPVIETNSIFLQLANLPVVRMHRSISNEAFLNFPR